MLYFSVPLNLYSVGYSRQAVSMGMRYGEIMGLQWQDSSFVFNHIVVRDLKTHEDRYVPMHPVIQEWQLPS